MKSLIPALSVALVLLSPVAARAGTVSLEYEPWANDKGSGVDTLVVYAAAPGETNRVTVTRRPYDDRYQIRDAAGVVAGEGCTTTPDPTVAECPLGFVEDFELGDGDDRLTATGEPPRTRAVSDFPDPILGGDGDDYIDFPATLKGGAGSDVLISSEGEVDGGEGPDVLRGTAVSYADRTEPVSATLDGLGNDGTAGEGDLIGSEARAVIGGSGGDQLSAAGRGARIFLSGGGGDDALTGGDGRDTLWGGLGRDVLRAGPGDDDLNTGSIFGSPDVPSDEGLAFGGEGVDELTGTIGRDLLVGGPGPDLIDGRGGPDDVRAADRSLDRVTCGGDPGSTASVDRFDLARECGSTRRNAPGIPRVLEVREAVDGFDLEVGCSQEHARGCRIDVRAKGRAGRFGRSLVIRSAAGRTGLGFVPLDRRGQRALERCRGSFVLVIRSRDTSGRRRTVREAFEVRRDRDNWDCNTGFSHGGWVGNGWPP